MSFEANKTELPERVTFKSFTTHRKITFVKGVKRGRDVWRSGMWSFWFKDGSWNVRYQHDSGTYWWIEEPGSADDMKCIRPLIDKVIDMILKNSALLTGIVADLFQPVAWSHGSDEELR